MVKHSTLRSNGCRYSGRLRSEDTRDYDSCPGCNLNAAATEAAKEETKAEEKTEAAEGETKAEQQLPASMTLQICLR